MGKFAVLDRGKHTFSEVSLESPSGCSAILKRDTSTQIVLQTISTPLFKNTIYVNTQEVNIGSGKYFALGTDNLIDANGDNTGSASISDNTLYYVYISNSLATYGALTLRASTSSPTNGYLNTSGNAANWRFVGVF